MVSLKSVQASNASIPTALPSGLVAVFVGGTSGIGQYTLQEFARLARRPRIYNIGRSEKSLNRIEAECKRLNADVEYTFIQADVSLIRSVDLVCEQIKAEENAINVLFLSAGTLIRGQKTEEGLHLAASLKHHSRVRFISNLLPLLQSATGIRRVVSVLCGTKEGTLNLDDLQGWNDKAGDMFKQRGHSSSTVTLIHEYFGQKAPTVSFIHDFPGNVKSNIARGTTGPLSVVLALYRLLGPLVYIPERESGQRHLYFATSARFRARQGIEDAVPLAEGVSAAKGIDGVEGSGVYSTDEANESAGSTVEELMMGYKQEGMPEKLWDMINGDCERIVNVTEIVANR